MPLPWRRVCVFAAILSTMAAAIGAPSLRAAPERYEQQVARLKVLVVHGPNLNLLGRREPQIYGTTTLDQINDRLLDLAKDISVDLVTVQSNHEGTLVDAFQAHMDDVDGAIINGAGLSFSSVSLHDAIKAMPFPVIEVHISNLGTRDEIHRHSILTPAVRGSIMGLGWRSYTAALRALAEMVREAKTVKRGQ
jgi:3-dehydroquinate dehydratase II